MFNSSSLCAACSLPLLPITQKDQAKTNASTREIPLEDGDHEEFESFGSARSSHVTMQLNQSEEDFEGSWWLFVL